MDNGGEILFGVWDGAPNNHTTGQRCFWIPGMGVFEMDNAKKYLLASGVAPQTPIPLQKRCFLARKGVFEYLGWGFLKWTLPKNII